MNKIDEAIKDLQEQNFEPGNIMLLVPANVSKPVIIERLENETDFDYFGRVILAITEPNFKA